MEGSRLFRGPLARPKEDGTQTPAAGDILNSAWKAAIKYRWFLCVVILPLVTSAFYLFAIAADQYESEAEFMVKTASQSNGGYNSSFAQMFGLSGALNPSQSDSLSVGDYLTSHDAVAALGHQMDLVAMFRRTEADFLSRLWDDSPTPERILKYYRRQMAVAYNSDTGLTTLTVHAFRPEDAYMIARALLALGEQRVNLLNQRALQNAEQVAGKQLKDAEDAVAITQSSMTRFRDIHRDVDPERSSAAQIGLVSSLQQQLALARAQLATMSGRIDAQSPQYVAQTDRVRALATQFDAQTGRLGGGDNSMAPGLSVFEDLKLRQDFAGKRYEAAATALQSAREQAARQQLYVVRVVEPNRPIEALYPQRWLILLGILCASLLIYGIGTLLIAGVREHTA